MEITEEKLAWAEKRAKVAEAFHETAVRERDAAWREIATLKAANAWLSEAMQPVLEVDIERFGTAGGCLHACEAVRKAQAIYKGISGVAE